DAFNSAYWSFAQAARWASANGLHWIECGAIDGVSWIHGLGYQPHLALWQDPAGVRRDLESLGLTLSQIDAAFPLSIPEGASLGIEYIVHTIRWAALAGCEHVDTTDDRFKPEGASDLEVLDHMRKIYRQVVPVAERYGITINIEPHGYYTTKPEFMAEMLAFVDSPRLRMNMDTGNTFIAGQDPVAFLREFVDKVSHVHIKDVSESLAAASRGDLTGIAVSHCAIGEGVNAQNIIACLRILEDHRYGGVLSLECEGAGGEMIERSLAWTRNVLASAKVA
ncbi:MAG TPA: hypothetical protein DEH78_03195, partial [Solibacterales bacterium]|nr:hypothetical protein [Bryobacterales bacterium]